MALQVISTPIRDDTPLGAISDVAAGLSQLPYKFRREDYLFNRNVNNEGYQRLYLLTEYGDLTNIIFINDVIYVKDSGHSIVTQVVFTGSFTFVGIDKIWIKEFSGYINLLTTRPDYLVLVEPLEVDTQESLLPRPESYKPQQNGELFIDLSGMISFVFQNKEAINFQLRVTEYYNNVTKDTIITDPVYALPAKKQIISVGGSNMWEYLLNLNPLAKQMTKFLNPITWIGWKTNLYHVLDVNYTDRIPLLSTVGVLLNATNINKGLLSTIDLRGSIGNLPRIYKEVIPESIKLVSNAYYVRSEFLNTSDESLSGALYYKINETCRNAIMLEWINSNGIPEQWLFEVSQDVTFQANDGFKYQRPIVNPLDEVSAPLRRIAFGEHQYMTLLAENLLQDQILALKEIKTSQEVWVWLDNDGDKKVGVIIESAFNTELTTKQNTGSFVVSIEFPKDFNFMP